MPPLKPHARDDLVVVDFGEELVVCLPGGSSHSWLHHLNPSAAIVFRLSDGTATSAEIAADIAEAFGLERETTEKEVRGAVRRFRQSGLLTAKPVAPRRRREAEHDHVHDHGPEEAGDEAGDERRRIRREVPDHE